MAQTWDEWMAARGLPARAQTPAERHAARTIGVMRGTHGVGPVDRYCGECVHLVSHVAHRQFWKCARFRLSASASSDWRKSWPACGLFSPRQGNSADG